ncbi:MAG: hypothetical protein CME06_18280 [Gemmatimonadetes bacterium]|nr:hypothetical protein [Gemmatimonadota bacterium]
MDPGTSSGTGPPSPLLRSLAGSALGFAGEDAAHSVAAAVETYLENLEGEGARDWRIRQAGDAISVSFNRFRSVATASSPAAVNDWTGATARWTTFRYGCVRWAVEWGMARAVRKVRVSRVEQSGCAPGSVWPRSLQVRRFEARGATGRAWHSFRR